MVQGPLVPENYRQVLGYIFSQNHGGLDISPEQFLEYFGQRIFTEWCMSPDEGKNLTQAQKELYAGGAITKFIEDQTLYAVQRAHEQGIINQRHDGRTFEEMKHKVLEAVVQRAVQCFERFGTNFNEQWPDGEYLRTDLKSYVGF